MTDGERQLAHSLADVLISADHGLPVEDAVLVAAVVAVVSFVMFIVWPWLGRIG